MVKYDFLKDPKAVEEINKFKWVESEKAGYDIGFEKAAKDWIEKHGEAYLEKCCKKTAPTVKKITSCYSKKPSKITKRK